MTTDVPTNLVAMIQLAVDLATSVAVDIEEGGEISNETAILVQNFNKALDELNGALDAEDGTH